MSYILSVPILILGGAMIGSIPWGYLAGKSQGVDVRQHGSGNIGATNVFRVLGKGWGLTVFVLDFLKGMAATLLGGYLGPVLGLSSDLAGILAGSGAILGHNFTPWLGFKGGKGIASSAGVLVGATPVTAAVGFAVWGVVLWLSRYVSLASIAAAVSLPLSTLALWKMPLFQGLPGGSLVLLLFCSFAALLAIVRHRSNISRLLVGTESRIGKGKDPSINPNDSRTP